MTALGASPRRSFADWARIAGPPILLAVLAVLSLSYPLLAPVVAGGGGAASYVVARQTASRIAWVALGVCAVVFALSLVIDLGLLSVNTVQIGHPKKSIVSN